MYSARVDAAPAVEGALKTSAIASVEMIVSPLIDSFFILAFSLGLHPEMAPGHWAQPNAGPLNVNHDLGQRDEKGPLARAPFCGPFRRGIRFVRSARAE